MEKRGEEIEAELNELKRHAQDEDDELSEYILDTLLKSATSSKISKNKEVYFSGRPDEVETTLITKSNFNSKIRAACKNLLSLLKTANFIHLELILTKKTYYVELFEIGEETIKRFITQEEYNVFAKDNDVKSKFTKLGIQQIKSLKAKIEYAITNSFTSIVSKISKLLFSAESNLSTSLNDVVLYKYDKEFLQVAINSLYNSSHRIDTGIFNNTSVVKDYFATYILSGKINKEGVPNISRLKSSKSHKFASILKHALKSILVLLEDENLTEEQEMTAKNAIVFISSMTVRNYKNQFTEIQIFDGLKTDKINEIYDKIIENYCILGDTENVYLEKMYFYISCYRAINILSSRKFEIQQLGSTMYNYVFIDGQPVSEYFYNYALYPMDNSVLTFGFVTEAVFNRSTDTILDGDYASSRAISAIIKIIGSKTPKSVRKTLPYNLERFLLSKRLDTIQKTCIEDYVQFRKVVEKKKFTNEKDILRVLVSGFSYYPSIEAQQEFMNNFSDEFLSVIGSDSRFRVVKPGYAQKYALTMNTLFKIKGSEAKPLKEVRNNQRALDLVEAINVLSFCANLNSLLTGELEDVGSPGVEVNSPQGSTSYKQLYPDQPVYNANNLGGNVGVSGGERMGSPPAVRTQSYVAPQTPPETQTFSQVRPQTPPGTRGFSQFQPQSSPGRAQVRPQTPPGTRGFSQFQPQSSPGRTQTFSQAPPKTPPGTQRFEPAPQSPSQNPIPVSNSPVQSPTRRNF